MPVEPYSTSVADIPYLNVCISSDIITQSLTKPTNLFFFISDVDNRTVTWDEAYRTCRDIGMSIASYEALSGNSFSNVDALPVWLFAFQVFNIDSMYSIFPSSTPR